MKDQGIIYTCDECGKQIVYAPWSDDLPKGWIALQPYTSYDRLSLNVSGEIVQVNLKEKHFCGTPCLTSHIGSTIAKAIEQKKNDALTEREEAAA